MTNPVLVNVTRGALVESRHRAAVAVVDAEGRLVASVGDIDRPVFPRSAVKALQALPLIESGTADRLGFGDAELALAISSHNGEERQVETARRMLASAGLGETCLECGPQWPERGPDQALLQRMGARAGRIHNNCSGKHAGFLCTAVTMGVEPAGYTGAGHPVMREVVAAVAAVTGAHHGDDVSGLDGCSIPTYAIPLRALAHGFARFATGHDLSPERARAAARLRRAAAAEPFMVAGTNRFDTRVMEVLGERAFTKTGAEGVYIAALPERGLAFAVKTDDGATRSSEVVTATLLSALLKFDEDERLAAALAPLLRPEIRSRAGEHCGEIRASEDLAAFAASLRGA